jgi:hypothetical protein
MEPKEMQTMITKAREAHGETAKALRDLADEPMTDAEKISRRSSAYSDGHEDGADDGAKALVEMISDALSRRVNATMRSAWGHGHDHGVTLAASDDGDAFFSASARGATMWDAAVNLAMVTGYYAPGEN